ncbi:hypothetical protein J7F03_25490 [Streptomyces sp. ISL-43]|uniref:hypothetical protein n=1 Tax=Streptomyces sp. ISL-43 TaxID=2819183 RepID=UPI001BE6735B|nr:hypothetical protein [Streptomyces sp. ISL-43]MBT2450370.1 hypothetical protein [Streptomyces sp. ISL-43]
MLKDRELRRRCKRELRSLGIQPPLNITVLCRLLGERRNRPIQLVPYRLPAHGPYGLWIATDTTDYIFHQQETSKPHQNHIIVHEIGHILADHQSGGLDDALLGAITPSISLDVVKRLLGRTSYDEEHEHEAEMMATIILEWACILNTVAQPVTQDSAAHRIQTALTERRGWL